MSILSKVTTGRLQDPYLVLIYGVEGIGKSTFAAYAPDPIFLASERGTSYLDVARLPATSTFDEVVDSLKALLNDQHNYKTFVIDTLDWLEPIIFKKVLADKGKGKKSIEDIGYAKGYIFALDYWRQIFGLLTELRNKRNMNVVLVGHSIVKTFHDPNLPEGYERYQLKLHDKASALVKEFVDFVLFATYETNIMFDEQGRKNRARGEGKRLLHTQHRPSFDAKSRISIPFTINLSWKSFDHHCKSSLTEDNDRLTEKLLTLADQISMEDIKQKVKESIELNKENEKELRSLEIQIMNIIA